MAFNAISAFIGYDNMKNIYETAVDKKYRFLSYGDAMLLEKNEININQTSEFARNAEIQFERGNIQTPAFITFGTNGTVKGLRLKTKINWFRNNLR